jgi:hypothetical protein
MSKGGKEGGKASSWNKDQTKDTDERIASLSGSLNHFYGKKHSIETRLQMSLSKRLLPSDLLDRLSKNSDLELLTPLSEYNSRQHQYLSFKCKTCGEIQQKNLYALERGSRCFKCHPVTKSAWELQVFDFIKDKYSDVQSGNRTVLSPKEIDVFIPSKNLGIECHGLYWHSRDDKNKNHSIEKLLAALQKDVKLLFLFEDEWRDNRPACESLLYHKLHLSDKRVHARQCKLDTLDNKAQKLFFDETHLAGNTTASDCHALVHDGVVVAALSLRKPRQSKYDGLTEVARYSCALGTHVPGALSKLLSVVKKPLMTYVDRRLGDGKGYLNCGFESIGVTGADYWYTDGINRYGRFMYRAQHRKTEKQVAQDAGVSKIYGCGSLIMIKK